MNGTTIVTTGVLAFLLLAGLPAADALRAQSDPDGNGRTEAPMAGPAAPAPFGPGEHLIYQVKLGVVSVGSGFMRVEGLDTVRGHETYHVNMGLDASAMFGLATVRDRYESWLDTRLLVSRRFIRDVHQINYKSRRIFEIYPEEQRWERADADQSGQTGSALALDEIAFLYFVRTLPLEVGAEYSFNRYFKEDGNPVRLKVLRKERVEVPAGTFDVIVVQPIINTDGLFSEGGEAEVYFTDDEKRHLVYLRSRIPLVGSVSLHLQEIREGTPLNSGGR